MALGRWGESIMHWGCVAASERGNTSEVKRKMNSSKYQQIPEANVTQ